MDPLLYAELQLWRVGLLPLTLDINSSHSLMSCTLLRRVTCPKFHSRLLQRSRCCSFKGYAWNFARNHFWDDRVEMHAEEVMDNIPGSYGKNLGFPAKSRLFSDWRFTLDIGMLWTPLERLPIAGLKIYHLSRKNRKNAERVRISS